MADHLNGRRWLRLDAHFPTDARMLAVGWDGQQAWLRMLAWTKAQQEDGHIPATALPHLFVGFAERDPTRGALAVLDDLHRAGLVVPGADGWTIPRWSAWQRTEDDYERAKRLHAERQRKYRARHQNGHDA